MPATIIMGGQWGDEGKGKLTDALAARARMVVRANGGSNAGHTIQTAKASSNCISFRPAFSTRTLICVIGAGVVIDPASSSPNWTNWPRRVSTPAGSDLGSRPSRTALSRRDRPHAGIAPGGDKIGTTLRGIGPAYADKAFRHGIRIGDLLDERTARLRVAKSVADNNQLLTGVYGAAPLDAESIVSAYLAAADRLRPHIAETEPLV